MAEDSADQESNEELIAGLDEGDLKPNFYEGGFKTWECALDLARLIASEDSIGFSDSNDGFDGRHVIEVCTMSQWFLSVVNGVSHSWVREQQSRLLRSLRNYYRNRSLSRVRCECVLPSQTIMQLFFVS